MAELDRDQLQKDIHALYRREHAELGEQGFNQARSYIKKRDVIFNNWLNAGPKNLDSGLSAIIQNGKMDLSDRSASHGHVVKLTEYRCRRLAIYAF